MPSLTLKTDFDTLARFAVAAELKGRRSGAQLLQDLVMEAIAEVKEDPRFESMVEDQYQRSVERSKAKRELALANRVTGSVIVDTSIEAKLNPEIEQPKVVGTITPGKKAPSKDDVRIMYQREDDIPEINDVIKPQRKRKAS